mgnify:FL=1
MPHFIPALFLFFLAVSLDSMTAGFSYGTQKVRIKTLSFILLVCVPALFITAANRLSHLLLLFLSPQTLTLLSFLLLFLIGCSKLTESLIRYLAQKYPSLARNWGCRIKQLNIIFTIYLSPEDANKDDLQVLSAKEALLLSLALSLDSILVGMAFPAGPVSWPLFLLLAMLFNLFLFASGYFLGRLLRHVLRIDLSWLSGLFLLLLAVHALS